MIHVAIHFTDEAILGGPFATGGCFDVRSITFCSRYLKDDVETRFNRLGRNDDGLPEEEPDKFQAVVWFVLKQSEVDTDILAYREDSPDNVETSFPPWFKYRFVKKKVRDGCSEELFSLACGPTSACTYPACIVNSVKFVVHERDILHTTQCNGVLTPGLDGESVLWSTRRISGWRGQLLDHHGGDAGGSPPRRPNRPVPAQCQSSMLRLETGNASLRKAFRENNKQPLQLGFDYGRLSYFNLAEWYNNQDKVVIGSNVYTVGERVRLGLELKLRLLWRKNKNRIKADHYTKHDSPDEAKNHPPPPRVWGRQIPRCSWNELVDGGPYESGCRDACRMNATEKDTILNPSRKKIIRAREE
ncbi:hypothetical protein Tco_0199641 [Tanacetum coccineum]